MLERVDAVAEESGELFPLVHGFRLEELAETAARARSGAVEEEQDRLRGIEALKTGRRGIGRIRFRGAHGLVPVIEPFARLQLALDQPDQRLREHPRSGAVDQLEPEVLGELLEDRRVLQLFLQPRSQVEHTHRARVATTVAARRAGRHRQGIDDHRAALRRLGAQGPYGLRVLLRRRPQLEAVDFNLHDRVVGDLNLGRLRRPSCARRRGQRKRMDDFNVVQEVGDRFRCRGHRRTANCRYWALPPAVPGCEG